jgi:hypothetical protein
MRYSTSQCHRREGTWQHALSAEFGVHNSILHKTRAVPGRYDAVCSPHDGVARHDLRYKENYCHSYPLPQRSWQVTCNPLPSTENPRESVPPVPMKSNVVNATARRQDQCCSARRTSELADSSKHVADSVADSAESGVRLTFLQYPTRQ